MKVIVFLGLLAVAALAITQGEKSKLNFHLKKKLIGGPDSLPFFLRPGYKKPEVKPVPVQESGFAETAKIHATNFKNKVIEQSKKFKDAVIGHAQKAHKFIKDKLAKKEEAVPTPTPEPVQESGFAEVKSKVVEHSKKFKDTVVGHAQRAHKWIKDKFTKKPEVLPTPVPEPVQESGFAEIHAKAKDHFNKFKTAVKGHVEKARKYIKDKFAKKEEVVPTPAPEPVQESGFAEINAKAKDHFNKFKTALIGHAQRAHKFIKDKFTKKEEAVPTPEASD